ncbi:MAG: hypothetical protein RIR62_1699 [Pseudomonadota bacterium]|jgi:hypothetical protein
MPESRYPLGMNAHVVELPDETEAWATARAEAEGFATLSDYMAHLVQRQKDIETLRAMLAEGQEDGTHDWTAVEAELHQILSSAAP